jgi:peptidoglycan/LPS O-acetylase OafA/YrhL
VINDINHLKSSLLNPQASAKSERNSQRYFGLDVLRFAAVTLVLHVHAIIEFNLTQPRGDGHRFTGFLDLVFPPGSHGVDLFFVLSGFLVAGLLFTEFIQRGTMSLGRFFVRRAFKIYPAFWVLIGLTVMLRYQQTGKLDFTGLLSELFFIQNYTPGLWGHTWSLAVEEHFYILLIGSFLMLKFFSKQGGKLNIHIVPRVVDAVLVVCMIARVLTWWYLPLTNSNNLHWSTWATHLRIDALFFGMLIAYWWHFRWDERIKARLMSRKCIFGVVGLILISPLPGHVLPYGISQIFRFVLVYLGAGCLLLASLSLKPSSGAGCFRWMAWLGRHSYSVYLWHMLVLDGLSPYLQTANPSVASALAIEAACHAACWVFGIFTARIIEFPILRLRDKFFPSLA